MGIFLAALAMLAAAVSWILAFRERQKANPDQKLPHFRPPPSSDGWALVYAMLGAGLLGGAGGYLAAQASPWAFLLLLAVVAPSTALIYRHNRQIDQRIPAPQ